MHPLSPSQRTRFACALVAATLAATGAGEAAILADNWYATTIDGKRVGHFHEHRETDVEGGRRIVRTAMDSKLTVLRMGTEVAVESKATFVETLDGVPLRFHAVNKVAAREFEIRAERQGDHFLVTQSAMGKATETEVPYTADLLFPHAIDQRLKATGMQPGVGLAARTFLPESARPTRLQVACTDRAEVELADRSAELLRCELSYELLPGVEFVEWRDGDAVVERTELALLGNDIVSVRTTRERALLDPAAVELLVGTLVDPGELIAHPRRVEHALFELTVTDPDLAITLPQDARQKVVQQGDGRWLLEVRAERWKHDDRAPSAGAAYRRPSAILPSDDPAIVAMAKRAGGGGSMERISRRLSRWVYTAIEKKSLSVGFATAKEVAEDLVGDCTEHAVLAAALARARGIPSKVAVGLVYLNGSFGYHMWTEVWDRGWHAIDPALGQEATDATHIKLGESALESGFIDESLVSLVAVIANLDIRVREYTTGGVRHRSGAARARGTIRGRRYENPVFGLRLKAPEGWALRAPDDAGPSAPLVQLEGPDGASGALIATAIGYDFRLQDWVRERFPQQTVVRDLPITVADRPGRSLLLDGPDGERDRLVTFLDRDTLFAVSLRAPDGSGPATMSRLVAAIKLDDPE